MKHAAILTLVLLMTAGTMQAQSYITAAGARFGGGIGISVQQRILSKSTVEGIIQSNLSGNTVRLTGLYQRHLNLLTRHFNVYGGLGLYKEWEEDSYMEVTPNPMGMAFVVGGEVTLGRVNLSLDFIPRMQLSGPDAFSFGSQVGVSARYVIIKGKVFDNKKKKRKRKRRKKDSGINWDIFDRG
ncbi:MAG: hypothetical protein GYB31_06700 [Bacteroidetes bacterium]|nr:hypothetical protein [Bacteroidota bacterium]